MMVLWCLIEKGVFKFGFDKRGIFNKIPFLHKAFHEDFWKGITSFFIKNHHPLSLTKLITGQTCVCLVNPTLALSRTISAFVS